MLIKSAKFVVSNTEPSKCPAPDRPEYAFIGRSNVGKSSLINMLTSNKKLAKTSSSPGKTRLINHFLINGEWYLVDLPGYGYAKVMRNERNKWLRFIREYMLTRQNLYCVMVLIDVRIKPQDIDLEFMSWLGTSMIPFVMVFTKTDKIKNAQVKKNIELYKEEMLKTWEEIPQIFITSAETGKGKEELCDFIGSIKA